MGKYWMLGNWGTKLWLQSQKNVKQTGLIQRLNSFEVSFQFGSRHWNCTLPEWQLVSFAGPAAWEQGFSFVPSSAYALTIRHHAWIALCTRHEAPLPEGVSLARKHKRSNNIKQYLKQPATKPVFLFLQCPVFLSFDIVISWCSL